MRLCVLYTSLHNQKVTKKSMALQNWVTLLYIQLQCYGNEQRKTVSFICTIQTHGPF